MNVCEKKCAHIREMVRACHKTRIGCLIFDHALYPGRWRSTPWDRCGQIQAQMCPNIAKNQTLLLSVLPEWLGCCCCCCSQCRCVGVGSSIGGVSWHCVGIGAVRDWRRALVHDVRAFCPGRQWSWGVAGGSPLAEAVVVVVHACGRGCSLHGRADCMIGVACAHAAPRSCCLPGSGGRGWCWCLRSLSSLSSASVRCCAAC